MLWDWRRIGLEAAATLCFAGAAVCLAALALLRWLIHGDYDRYVWLISGPGVFGQMGGGPFQLWLGGGLALLALSGLVAGAALRGRLAKGGWRGWPAIAVGGAAFAALLGAYGVLILA